MAGFGSFQARLTDVEGEKNEVRSPIFGLRSIPLVTLTAALTYVVGAGLVEQHVVAACEFLAYDHADQMLRGGPDANGLSRDEIASIHLYTQESPFYGILNQLLRTADRSQLKPFLAYLKLFFTAIYKIPGQAGTFYRGIKLGLDDLAVCAGVMIIWWGVSSTTKDVGKLKDPQFLGSSGKRTLFALTVKKAYDICRYSAMGNNEEELILLPGLCLEMSGTPLDLDKAGGKMVQLTEKENAPVLHDFPVPSMPSGTAPAATLAPRPSMPSGPCSPAPAAELAPPSGVLTLFHGTTKTAAEDIKAAGFIVPRDNPGFFGRAIYLTSCRQKAEAWARYKAKGEPHFRMKADLKEPRQDLKEDAPALVSVLVNVGRCKVFSMDEVKDADYMYGAYHRVSLDYQEELYGEVPDARLVACFCGECLRKYAKFYEYVIPIDDDLGRLPHVPWGYLPQGWHLVKDNGTQNWTEQGYDSLFCPDTLPTGEGALKLLPGTLASMSGDEYAIANSRDCQYLKYELI